MEKQMKGDASFEKKKTTCLIYGVRPLARRSRKCMGGLSRKRKPPIDYYELLRGLEKIGIETDYDIGEGHGIFLIKSKDSSPIHVNAYEDSRLEALDEDEFQEVVVEIEYFGKKKQLEPFMDWIKQYERFSDNIPRKYLLQRQDY